MPNDSLSIIERKATLAIASIFALRMLGLFMVLPLFSLYASHLQNATPFLMGLALGCYGFTQAVLQIPFGLLSDRYDRKSVIGIGLIMFIIGSLIAAASQSIYGMIAGRALQGAGAVGSATLALLSDLTGEQQRTKAMAIVGIIIGMSFIIAMVLGPLLNHWFDIPSLFGITALFGLVAIFILYTSVPTSIKRPRLKTEQPLFRQLAKLLQHRDLMRLNFGILTLHAVLTASFIAVPVMLKESVHFNADQQWLIYLPALLAACLVMAPIMIICEKKQKNKPLFLGAISTLAVSQLILSLPYPSVWNIGFGLFVFFFAFTLLEALLPSWVSKTAPAENKGTALGIYSCCQFLGIFVGGIIGGWLYGQYQLSSLFYFSTLLIILWLILANTMTALAKNKPFGFNQQAIIEEK